MKWRVKKQEKLLLRMPGCWMRLVRKEKGKLPIQQIDSQLPSICSVIDHR